MYAGQTIVLTANAGEWWSGYVEDDPSQTVGQFPANYVEEMPADGEQPADGVSAGSGPAVVAPVIPGFEEPLVTAIAIYDYPAGEPGDLAFSANDTICVTAMDGDWWQGYVEGSPMVKGQFPSNYVQKTGSSGEAGGGGQRATCIFEYVASQAGDLTMQVNDVIVVVDSSDPNCKLPHFMHTAVCEPEAHSAEMLENTLTNHERQLPSLDTRICILH